MKGEKVFPECFAFGQKRFIFPTKVLASPLFSSNGTKLYYSAGSSMTLSFWYILVLTLSIKIKKGKSLCPKCIVLFFCLFLTFLHCKILCICLCQNILHACLFPYSVKLYNIFVYFRIQSKLVFSLFIFVNSQN